MVIIHHICDKFPSAYMQGNKIIVPYMIQSAQGRSKQVSFELTLPYNYPQNPPTIQLKCQESLTKDHKYIDRHNNNRIHHPKLSNWSKNNNLSLVLDEIIQDVVQDSPSFASENNNQNSQFSHQNSSNAHIHQYHLPYNTNIHQNPYQQPVFNHSSYHPNQMHQSQQQPPEPSFTVDSLLTLNQNELQKLSIVQLRELILNKSKIQEFVEKDPSYQQKNAHLMELQKYNDSLSKEIGEMSTTLKNNADRFNSILPEYKEQLKKMNALQSEREQLLKEMNDTTRIQRLLMESSDEAKRDSNKLNFEDNMSDYIDAYMTLRMKFYADRKKCDFLKIASNQPYQQSYQHSSPSGQTPSAQHYSPYPYQQSSGNRNSFPTQGNPSTFNPMFSTPQP